MASPSKHDIRVAAANLNRTCGAMPAYVEPRRGNTGSVALGFIFVALLGLAIAFGLAASSSGCGPLAQAAKEGKITDAGETIQVVGKVIGQAPHPFAIPASLLVSLVGLGVTAVGRIFDERLKSAAKPMVLAGSMAVVGGIGAGGLNIAEQVVERSATPPPVVFEIKREPAVPTTTAIPASAPMSATSAQ